MTYIDPAELEPDPVPRFFLGPPPDPSDMLALIHWYQRAYADNRPTFATELPWGDPLEDGKAAERAYDAIFGTGGNPTPGTWEQCSECGAWSVRHPAANRNP